MPGQTAVSQIIKSSEEQQWQMGKTTRYEDIKKYVSTTEVWTFDHIDGIILRIQSSFLIIINITTVIIIIIIINILTIKLMSAAMQGHGAACFHGHIVYSPNVFMAYGIESMVS
jgi:hypothetical protein